MNSISLYVIGRYGNYIRIAVKHIDLQAIVPEQN